MITEKGTIKVETTLDEKAQKEFMAKLFIVSLVCLIIGSIGIAAYLVWDITAIILETYEPSIFILFVVMLSFAFGLIFIISRNKVVKKARAEDKREEYEFFSNYLIANDYLNGEQVATVKIYYKQISKRRETKNYLFFFIQTNAACALSKEALTEGELNTVRALLGFSARGAVNMNLPSGEEEKPQQEPFEDMKPTAGEKPQPEPFPEMKQE